MVCSIGMSLGKSLSKSIPFENTPFTCENGIIPKVGVHNIPEKILRRLVVNCLKQKQLKLCVWGVSYTVVPQFVS